MKIGLVGPSYQERMPSFDRQRSVNLFPVFDKFGGSEVAALYGTPGLMLFTTLGAGGANRGHFAAANGRAFAVIGSTLWEIDSAGNGISRGGFLNTSGIVSMDENGFQLAICDGQNLFIFTYATNAFQQVNDPDLPSCGTVTFIDGYFVVNQNNSGKFYISALYDGLSWNALDFATAESSPDDLLRVYNAVGQLWLLGAKTTEIWTNTGARAFPFQRISGAKMETGILAPHTTAAIDNSILWVGRDGNGQGIVYRARGFSAERISTSPIEKLIQEAPDQTNLRSRTYQQEGRTFYIITGGGMSSSLVYDLSTQLWHEIAYLNPEGEFEEHLGCCGMFAFGYNLVGDRRNGNIYILSQDEYTDNGEPLCRERIYTHLIDESKRIRYNSLVIGFESGVGTQTGQGADPMASLQLSQDGARTWSNWFTVAIGKAGKFQTQSAFRRLGIAQIMTFKLRVTDPIPVMICGSYLS